MDGPLDEQYLRWLYAQVASVRLRNPARTYWSLLRHLYRVEYVWFVPNDDNRVEDGRDLRCEFLREMNIDPDPEWTGFNCSTLEMLIGLSRRFAFEADDKASDCFWEMLTNIGLENYSDLYYTNRFTEQLVNDAIMPVIDRTYETDGKGGLFPLNDPHGDQTKVELWFQLASYILERDD